MKKRRSFQIHLSTAIVLMLVASGLLWAQFQPSVIEAGLVSVAGRKIYFISTETSEVYFVNRGWPAYNLEQQITLFHDLPQFIERSEEIWDDELKRIIPKHTIKFTDEKEWLFQGIAINAAVAIAILGFVVVGGEWFIRRREARKP